MRLALSIFVIDFSTVAYACRLRIVQLDTSLNPFPPAYETAWREAWADLRTTRPHILADILKRGGPEARTLRLWGFERKEGGGVTHGTFHEFLIANDRVAGEGRPNGAPILIPGLLFRKSERIFEALGLGQAPEPSWRVVPISQITPEAIGWLFHFGYIPMSLERLDHDVFHTLSTATYKDYAQELFDLRQHHVSGNSKLQSAHEGLRFAYLYEAFTVVTEADRNKMLEVLGAPFLEGREKDLTLEKLLASESDTPIATIRGRAETLLRAHYPLCIYYGGAGREMSLPGSGIHYREHFVWESIPSIAMHLRHALNDKEYFGAKPDVRIEYARLRLALYYSIGMTPRKYAAAAIKEVPLDSDDPVYRLFIHSGIGTRIRGDRDGVIQNSFARPLTRP